MEKPNKKHQILSNYMDFILENGQEPKSIYAFTKSLEIEEKEFYEHFTSFDQIAAEVYVAFYEETIKLMMSEISYNDLDAKNELLVFYYTYFELLTNNRSYILASLKNTSTEFKKLKQLAPLRTKFKGFIKSLNIETINLKAENLNKIKETSIEELAWTQFLFTLKFWIDDTSAGFEKTDIFIEKSVNASFDFLNTTPLNNIIDLGKFFLKKKSNLNSNKYEINRSYTNWKNSTCYKTL